MNEVVPLEKAAAYVTSKVSSSNVTVESFVTVDNLLPDRAGLTTASGLPPAGGFMPAYMEGDILVGNIRPYLKKIWFANIDGGCSNDVLVIRANPGYSPKFLYYALLRDEFFAHMMNGKKGTKMPRGDKKQIMRFPIPEFQYSEQVEIASVLSALDAKIALNTRINAELEALAKLIYDYWFVQFDFPISAAQAKRMGKPNLAGKPYKSSGGAMVHNQELKREVPEGWTSALLADCIDRDWSGDWGQEEQSDEYSLAVNCIRGADLDGLNGVKESYPPVRYILPRNQRKVLHSHDLIVEISGGTPTQSTGRLAFITEETLLRFKHPLVCSNFCKAVSIKNKEFLYNFAHHWNDLYAAGALFGHEGKTSGIRNLLFDSFTNAYRIVVPEASVLKKFYSMMQTFQAKKQQGLVENQELTTLRDWLLPLLMNGQVRVSAPLDVTPAKENIGLALAAEPAGRYGKKKG